MIKNTPLVSVMAILVIASLSCTNPIQGYFSTQTAIMETATANMWTLTPTNTPTSTPTITPTNTPTFTPTPDFLYTEDFSNTRGGWLLSDTATVLRAYYLGGYRILVRPANHSAWSGPPNRRNYTDIKIEVDAKKIGGPDDNNFGILCRLTDNKNFYGLEISTAGGALIYKYVNGELTGLSSDYFQSVDGIKAGEEVNQIIAICNGDSLELYANGNLVASATDSSFSSGEIGLSVGTYDNPGADILFDNLFVMVP
jgi:hypothetical protein